MDGVALNLDASFLNDLNKVDKKMKDIINTSQAMSKTVIDSFKSMNAQGVQPFISKITEAQKALANMNNGNKSSKNSGIAKTVDDINKMTSLISRSAGEWQAHQVQISALEKRMSQLTQATRSYEANMARINSGKGGVVTNAQTKEYQENLKNLDIVKQEIAVLRQKQETIISTNQAINRQVTMLQQLMSYNSQQGSIPEQRKNEELKKMNQYYRELEKSSKKAADEEEKAAKATQRKAEAASKAAQRSAQSQDTKNINAYNQAMKASEATINQRINKIAKLRQIEEQLSQNEAKYATQLARVRSEMDRLSQSTNNATNAANKHANATNNVQKSHRHLMNTTGQLQRKLALLFSVSAIQGYMNKLVSVRGEFEMQQKSLQVLLQNKDEADKLWQQTVDLAVQSPFRVKELVSYTRQLAAYRIETEKIHDTTRRLADVSAGLGVDMFRIILAFGQVRAANYLRGTELRQFTEAGIPMLDELAKYFTEMEGRAVSAGDVFERISKRMVAFSDVEEVFKRMTDAGGVFYRMQEEQSNTLQGMISNLHDSIDLMLNDIGKANDGTLKGVVENVKTLVDNWRVFATILQQVGAVVAVVALRKAVLSIVKLSPQLYALAGGIKSFGVATTAASTPVKRLIVSLNALKAAMLSNPLFIGGVIAATLASAIHAMYSYNQAIDAANKKYDEASEREMRRLKTLEELNKKASENNKVLQDTTKTEKELNEARGGNISILNQLKKDYPEIYSSIVKQKNGTIDFTNALEKQNEILRVNIALQQQAKGGIFQEDQSKNYKDAIEAQGKLISEIYKTQAAAISAGAKLEYAFSQGKVSQESYNELSKLFKAISDAKGIEELGAAFGTTNIQNTTKDDRVEVRALWNEVQKAYSEASNANDKYNQSLDNLFDNFKNQLPTIIVELNKLENPQERGKWLESKLQELGILDEEIKEWAKVEIPKAIKLKVEYPKATPQPVELQAWQESYNELFQGYEGFKKITNIDTERTNVLDRLNGALSVQKELVEKINATGTGKGSAYEGYDKATEETKLKQLQEQVRWFGVVEKNTKGQGKDWASEMIKGIKEAHQEYIKLNKTLNATESKQIALAKYQTIFAEAAKNAGIKDVTLGQFSFETEQGTIDALKYLKDKLPATAKQARFQIEKAIGDIKGELRLTTKVQEDKALIDQIEEMFSGYELSLELEKLNIPPDLAKQLFNVDSLTLPELKNQVISMESKFVGTDMEDEYKKFLEKIDEMEENAQIERLKKYTKYLIKGQGERVKIKMEEMRQLAEIETLGYTDAQKALVQQAIKDESKQKMDKLEWEEFKDSGMYVQLFEDLEYASTNALQKMRERLLELKTQLSNLDADDLKHLYSQIEKLDEQLAKRNPYKTLITGVDDYIEALKESKRIESELDKQGQVTRGMQSKEVDLSEQLSKEKSIYEQMSKSGKASQKDLNDQKLKINFLNAQLAALKAQLAAQGLLTQELEQQLDGYKNVRKTFEGSLSDIGSDISEAANALPNIAANMENVFGTMSAGTKDTIDSISEIGSGVGSAIQGFESGNYIQAVAGVAQAIGGIFAIGDKKKERQIQREIEKVEELEHAYDKLEKSIDDAYSLNTLQQSGKLAKKNIDEQIKSYEKMIAAEEDKKKTDHDRIKEWEEQIEALREQQEELNEQLVSTATGGIMDSVLSAAQEFTDAWLKSFQDTADGLSGLKDNFKETMLEMVKQQASMLITQKYVEQWKSELEKYINADDLELTTAEAGKWVDSVTSSLPQLNDALENYFNSMKAAGVDISGDGGGELSGLAKGISGITEQQADVLAAYWNSCRFFLANIDTTVTNIANQILGGENTPNPMLSELRMQTDLVRSIRDMFSSVIKQGHSTYGGAFLKVSL